MMRRNLAWSVAAGATALFLLAGALPTHAQAPADSIARWTMFLTSGTLEERMLAYSPLGHEEVATLPSATIDAAPPELQEELARGGGGIYETLGYAWFWADSTGAALSESGRATILDLLHTLPPLEQAASEATPAELLRRTARIVRLRCSGIATSFCQNLTAAFDDAVTSMGTNDFTAAGTSLRETLALADAGRTSGAIDRYEHALFAGGARQVLDVLPPTPR